jgi:mono/diheme cytochrome c family protein
MTLSEAAGIPWKFSATFPGRSARIGQKQYNKGMRRFWFLAVFAWTLGAQVGPTTATSKAVDFTKDIEPLLAKRCSACHGAGQQMGGLRFDEIPAAIKAGAIVPGKSEESKLVHRVASTKKGVMMPPMGERLSAAEIAALKAWIDDGAKLPTVISKGGRASHWAFQPVRRPATPQPKTPTWVRNPIDAFILARLDAENVQPSPEASKQTLLRRVSLDLTGLPPTPAELTDFLEDNRPDAYERVVDRLLSSPHYGERWARHWLDLARFADSDGYEKDQVRPWAWRYRNWVINAFNSDMPFDQFTVEQLAGDLLPNATVEQKVATGFHRNVLVNREAGVDRSEARFEQDVNRVNTMTTVWMGLTVGCAQCHNHKYDPISQKEFYQVMAYVNELAETDIDAPLPGEIGPYLRARPAYVAAREAILKEHKVLDYQAHWENKMRMAIKSPGTDSEWDFWVTSFSAMVDNGPKILMTEPADRTVHEQETLTDYFVRNNGPEYGKQPAVSTCLKDARDQLTRLASSYTPITQAMAVSKNPTAPKAYLAIGGDYKSKGATVEPGVPAILGGAKAPDRLSFARWLVSKDNIMTARVTANRIWQEFFGRGLVRTSEDFGTQGERPSHPELLDWLASEFMDANWSMKALQKQIVMSATYRQSSQARPELMTKDPENTLLARQGRLRLPAELIRDSALSASGLLNTAIGGKSIRPPQPAGVAELGYGNSVKWQESEGPEQYRRGLYIHFQRTTPYPMLVNFDAPNSNVSCSRRPRSNTPLQALNLLNDPVFLESAQGLALRVLREAKPAFSDRLDYAFMLGLGRKPKVREKERLAQYFDQQSNILRADNSGLFPKGLPGIEPVEASAWVGVSRVLFNLDEFITRE